MHPIAEHLPSQDCWCNPYVVDEGVRLVMREPAMIVRADPVVGTPSRMILHVAPVSDDDAARHAKDRRHLAHKRTIC